MYLLLGQLVYTSFAGRGFTTLASKQVPIEIQQTFMQLVSQYWDSYNPPVSGYRAVFLHQISSEQTLFGWLYNDGTDDMGRSDVPLFVCYYLTEPLFDFQLANIFICLEKGPVALIDRHDPSACLETKVVPNLWSYQPAVSGVAIPLAVRQRSYFALRQDELLELFVPIDKQEKTIGLSGQTYEQQIAISIYTRYVIDGFNPDVTVLESENAAPSQAAAIQAYQSYKQKLQLYKRVLGKTNRPEYRLKPNARSLFSQKKTSEPSENYLAQQNVAINTVETINKFPENSSSQNSSALLNSGQPLKGQILIENNIYDSELVYKKTQLLLAAGIAAATLALAFGIYGLKQASVSGASDRESISWARSPVVYKTLADVPVPQGRFKYGGSTSFAPLRSPAIVGAIALAHPEFKLIYTDPIPHKHGSTIGIQMLIAGQLSFVQSSRPLKETEVKQAQQKGLSLGQIPVAIDGIAFYVNPQVSILGLSLNQIRDIFTGKITNWKQVGGIDLPIVPFSLNPQYSGTADLIETKVLAGVKFSPNVRLVETTTETIRQVAKTPGGISYATASEVIGQRSIDPLSLAVINLLPLSIADNQDFISPFDINNKNIVNSVAFANGSYPLTRRLFAIVKRNGGVDEQAGIAYANLLFSEEGQLMLEQAGFVSIR